MLPILNSTLLQEPKFTVIRGPMYNEVATLSILLFPAYHTISIIPVHYQNVVVFLLLLLLLLIDFVKGTLVKCISVDLGCTKMQ